MKKFLVFSLLLAAQAWAAPKKADYEWTVKGEEHPLYSALAVNEKVLKSAANKQALVTEKVAGAARCVQSTQRELSTTCKVQRHPSVQKIKALYGALNVAERTDGHLEQKIKMLSKLLLIKDTAKEDNESKLIFNHPCQYVNNAKQANRCLGFWSTKLWKSYEELNDLELVDEKSEALADMKFAFSILLDPGHVAQNLELAEKSDVLGAVLHFQDETHLYYVGLSYGKDVVPQKIYEMNTVDLDGSLVAYGLKANQQKKIDETLERLTLRIESDAFDYLRKEIKESLIGELESLE